MKNKIKNLLQKTGLFKYYVKVSMVIEYFISNMKFCLDNRRDSFEVSKLKNIHNNERCFIIGNGPSLRSSDLDKIKDEITFASNKINKIFNETEWRPTYYTVFDDAFIRDDKNIEIIKNMEAKMKFLRKQGYKFTKEIKDNTLYLDTKYSSKYLKNPKFSKDISKFVYTIATVTYVNIQIAVYMGIKEIYFIGMDNNYAINRKADGTIEVDKSIKSYFGDQKEEESKSIGSAYQMNIAFEAAKKYCDENHIKIFNATRGGKLEIFDRVNFDNLF